MPSRCVVAGCSNTTRDGVSLHLFPRDDKLRRMWADRVNLTRANWAGPTDSSAICSAHFPDGSFDEGLYQQFSIRRTRRLKADAVPTLITTEEMSIKRDVAPVRSAAEKRGKVRSKGNKGSDVSLHCFPSDEERRKKWEDACGRTELPKDPRLCSRHFSLDAFEASHRRRLQKELTGVAGSKRKLKPDAVPTVSPHEEANKRPRAASGNRAKKRRQQTLEPLVPGSERCAAAAEEPPQRPAVVEESDSPPAVLVTLSEEDSPDLCLPTTRRPIGTPTSRPKRAARVKRKKNNNPSSPDYVQSVFKCSKPSRKGVKRRLKGGNEGRPKRKTGSSPITPSVLYVSVPRAPAGHEGTKRTGGNQVTSSVESDIIEVVIYEEDSRAQTQTCNDKDTLSTEFHTLLSEKHQLKERMSAVDLSEDSFRDSDEKTKVYTGVTTFALFLTVYDLILPNLQRHQNAALSPFQQLLLTLMKLRLNAPLQYLSYVFRVPYAAAERTFCDVVQILNAKFVPLILFWPEREQIRSTMPYAFQATFPKCASIIDSFEVLVERPAASDAKALQDPPDKSHNGMKYLISVTPQGFVSFVSRGWGGCTSERLLTERCGYLRNLQPGDTVLAPRDFSVGDVVATHGAELQIPDFTKSKELSYREIVETRPRASLRKRIERMIGNVRHNYPILQSAVPRDFLQTDQSGLTTLDKIVRVACGLCNICEPAVPFD